jgi:hypothetical protein
MKLLALITIGALGLVLLRRRRPELAQRLEGAAKDAAAQRRLVNDGAGRGHAPRPASVVFGRGDDPALHVPAGHRHDRRAPA